MQDTRLLLVSRDDILAHVRERPEEEAEALFRLLATLSRRGFHLLVTAPQPEQWTGQHGSPDDALLGPESIRKRVSDAGGLLDGVYYVRRSLLTQGRNREAALQDILERFAVPPWQCVLLSSHRRFIGAAADLGIRTRLLGAEKDLCGELSALVAAEPATP